MRVALFTSLAAVLCGCNSVGYYAQAIKGHCQIMGRQVSCKKVLSNTNTSPDLRAQLQLAGELCEFAEEQLGLPSHGAYRRYADLQRPYVVWNVYAAPRDSLEPKTWWYPFVGSLDYRGYFSETAARRYAHHLEQQGLDVYVEGVEAYSTLGWFNDPLLNTFIHHSEPVLAEVIFHELAHQRVFAPGDTAFNEAFATVAAEAGVKRWLREKGEASLLTRYKSALAAQARFVAVIQTTRQRLKQYYASATPGQLMSGRREILARLREDVQQLPREGNQFTGYVNWLGPGLNNAQLNSVATYYHLVPQFEHLLVQQEGDLEEFYSAVHALTKLPKEERHERLGESSLSQTAAASASRDQEQSPAHFPR